MQTLGSQVSNYVFVFKILGQNRKLRTQGQKNESPKEIIIP